jgi:tetratricopeptide (TPR) repeat protein
MQDSPFRWRALIAAVLLTIGGCTSNPTANIASSLTGTNLPCALELSETPFFAQEAYQCGPAALATILVASGLQLTPEELTAKIFLPQRQGSLQLELISATRRHGRLPYVLDPDLAKIILEISDNRPVLVLQNLGLASYPIWHYAVVIGYDAEKEQLILRSGDQRRFTMSTAKFMRSWALSKFWAMVVLRPGEMPMTADEKRYINSIAALEGVSSPAVSARFYATALSHWPENTLANFGLGNSQYALGSNQQAEASFRRVLALQPKHTAARNNLAYLLAQRGCRAAALDEIERGLAYTNSDDPVRRQLEGTKAEILDSIEPDSTSTEHCDSGL